MLERKLENALALDYPRDRLEIVVVSDGSTDRTNEIARALRRPRRRPARVPGQPRQEPRAERHPAARARRDHRLHRRERHVPAGRAPHSSSQPLRGPARRLRLRRADLQELQREPDRRGLQPVLGARPDAEASGELARLPARRERLDLRAPQVALPADPERRLQRHGAADLGRRRGTRSASTSRRRSRSRPARATSATS